MTRREAFGLYTAVEGKLAHDDARKAYVLGPCCTGGIAPVASHWTYEEAVRYARERQRVTRAEIAASDACRERATPLGPMTAAEYTKITGRKLADD